MERLPLGDGVRYPRAFILLPGDFGMPTATIPVHSSLLLAHHDAGDLLLLDSVSRNRMRHLLAVALIVLTGCANPPGPDHIFRGGPILTVDAGGRVVEAMAIRGNVISAVGSEAEVLSTKDGHTEIHDLGGRTLMPGFIAAHEDLTLTAALGGAIDVSGFTRHSSTEVWGTVREAIAKTPRGRWIYAIGIDPILVPGLQMPTLRILDAIAPDHPLVLVAQTTQSYWANSRALAEAGIMRDTPDPGNGSFYGRDFDGNLNGFLSERAAAKPLLAELTRPWRMVDRYGAVLDGLLEHGFTTVTSMGNSVSPMLAHYAASDRFQPRIRQFFYLAKDDLDSLPDDSDRGDNFLRILGVKLRDDGSPCTGSMMLQEPYLASPLSEALGIANGSSGEPTATKDDLAMELRRYSTRGWAIAIQSQGDRSAREVLHALAEAPDRGDLPPRRIEHGLLLPKSLLMQMARLRVTPSFDVNLLYYYGDALADSLLGPERTARILPVKSAFALGLRPTLHADSPMFPAEPFSLMRTAMLRQTRSGRVIGAEEQITIEQALETMTINGAYQLGLDDRLGSLEIGKLADFQMLTGNPLEIAAPHLPEIHTIEVWVDGRHQNLHGR